MDPNANLNEFRDLRDDIRTAEYRGEKVSMVDLFHVFELYEAMDTWLTKGGFLPRPWADALGAEHWQNVLTSTNNRAVNNAVRAAMLPLVEQIETTLENYPDPGGPR